MKATIGQILSADEAMELAIEVASQGKGFVAPNPLVGCVIVDEGHRLLGAGAHLKFGEAHAEINALASLTDIGSLKGATIYVTLEPCSHKGNTGSCARRLAQYPIHKVVYGALDPNPLVAGQGLKILNEAGIETQLATKFETSCQRLAEQFFYHIENQRPFIALKVASSLDGQIALETGESQWITGEESRRYARSLRAHYQATLIGAGTFINDNPSLDFRETSFEGVKSNRVVIVDPKGKAAAHFTGSTLASKHKRNDIFVLCPAQLNTDWQALGFETIDWSATAQGWDQALSELYQQGVSSIYVEGGAFVFGQCLQHRLMHKLYHFQAPVVMGQGRNWSAGYSIDRLNQALIGSPGDLTLLGSDLLRVIYFPKS